MGSTVNRDWTAPHNGYPVRFPRVSLLNASTSRYLTLPNPAASNKPHQLVISPSCSSLTVVKSFLTTPRLVKIHECVQWLTNHHYEFWPWTAAAFEEFHHCIS